MAHNPAGKLPLVDFQRANSERNRAIKERIQTELHRSSYSAVRRVSCECDNGIVMLRGRLPSFYLKQVAQNEVLRCIGRVASIDNQLEVV